MSNEGITWARAKYGSDITLLEWAVGVLMTTPIGPDNASIFHRYLEDRFRRAGMTRVAREVRVARGPTRSGRLDLVLSYPDERPVAIEIDWRKPRFKSLQKLRNFDGHRIMVLRRREPWHYELAGIDAVICIPATDPVKAFYASLEATKK